MWRPTSKDSGGAGGSGGRRGSQRAKRRRSPDSGGSAGSRKGARRSTAGAQAAASPVAWAAPASAASLTETAAVWTRGGGVRAARAKRAFFLKRATSEAAVQAFHREAFGGAAQRSYWEIASSKNWGEALWKKNATLTWRVSPGRAWGAGAEGGSSATARAVINEA